MPKPDNTGAVNSEVSHSQLTLIESPGRTTIGSWYMNACGSKYVLSIEPEPDYAGTPYAVKPLIGDITDAGPGVLQPTMNMALQTLPSGAASWQ